MRMIVLSALAIVGCQMGETRAAAESPSYEDALRCYGTAFTVQFTALDLDTGGTHSDWFKRTKAIGKSEGRENVAGDLGRAAGQGVVGSPYPSAAEDPEAAKKLADAARACHELSKSFATSEEASK